MAGTVELLLNCGGSAGRMGVNGWMAEERDRRSRVGCSKHQEKGGFEVGEFHLRMPCLSEASFVLTTDGSGLQPPINPQESLETAQVVRFTCKDDRVFSSRASSHDTFLPSNFDSQVGQRGAVLHKKTPTLDTSLTRIQESEWEQAARWNYDTNKSRYVRQDLISICFFQAPHILRHLYSYKRTIARC